jgi:Ca2+/Na+ antiporter
MKNGFVYALAFLGVLILLGFEIASIYYIMPFPGSQREESIDLAYFLVTHRLYFRLAGFLLLAYPIFKFVTKGTTHRVLLVALVLLYLMVFYQVNYRMRADAMFKQPRTITLLNPQANKVEESKLVVGLLINQQARAYPIEVIGYHHQVRDTVGGEQVMITYCTVCRTGRVFKPKVNGELENFRLVGMDHFNAMFEDNRTKSWWRQANGEAIAGPLKGTTLEELPSEQMTLKAWIERYPTTLILQPDSIFKDAYAELEKFDEGTTESSLERRDSLSWQEKSWVVGVEQGAISKAYDWNELLQQKVINDLVGETPVLVALQPDSISFHVWNRDSLSFEVYGNELKDVQTSSKWNWQGKCVEGPLQGSQLKHVQSYQEFWHSWLTFHPNTSKYDLKQ